jgi:hypothetical protein
VSSDEENKEITVKAPTKPVDSSEKKAEEIAQKALEQERFNVLEFPKKISRYMGMVVTATGVLLVLFFVYMAASGQTDGILLSSGSGSLSLVAWGFVGLLNIVVGFLFLGRE